MICVSVRYWLPSHTTFKCIKICLAAFLYNFWMFQICFNCLMYITHIRTCSLYAASCWLELQVIELVWYIFVVCVSVTKVYIAVKNGKVLKYVTEFSFLFRHSFWKSVLELEYYYHHENSLLNFKICWL